MKPPFDRGRLRERNVRDQAEERATAARLSPSERLEQTLELSQLVRALSHATGSDVSIPETDLVEKARLYAHPLRILATAR